MLQDDLRACAGAPAWETVALRDLTDCLLDAYDLISRRAYRRYVLGGKREGKDLEHWFRAERELMLRTHVDIEDAPNYISALATVPALRAEEIEVAIESRWLVILARAGNRSEDFGRAESGETRLSDSGSDSPRAAATEDCAANFFDVIELPAEVDPASSLAVLSSGLLGVRMLKKRPAR